MSALCPQTSAESVAADQPRIAGQSSAGKTRLGPQSRAIDRGSVGWSIDGRSREGRFLRAYERMLAEHVGGQPSRVQRELIRRCARLALHLELQDERSMLVGEMGDGMSRRYLAWNNSLARTLRLLGLEGAAVRQPSRDQILAALYGPADGH